jgi:Tfp pilus assembly protein PilP
MMRRTMYAIALLAAAAVPASAQMPPSIKGPIDAAKRQANKTSAQINEEQKVGNDPGRAAQMPAAAAQSATQGAAQKGAPSKQAAPAPKAAARIDTAEKRGTVTQSGSKGTVTFYRETFSYPTEGRRDPFLSLMATGELRPMISDLTLVGVIYDPTGRNSVAILVDASAAGQTYRKKLGDTLGRMKVTKISENSITLSVDDFGFARQETLPIDRNPRTGARRP